MSQDPVDRTVYNEIVALLDARGAEYQLITHGHAITSMDTARETGFDLHHGAKSIVFKTGGEFQLVVVRGDHRADFKKLRKHFGTNKIRMASEEEVFEQMRVRVGACYPFGEVAGLNMIVDATLKDVELVHFSPGTHYDHIQMSTDEYFRVVEPTFADIALDD